MRKRSGAYITGSWLAVAVRDERGMVDWISRNLCCRKSEQNLVQSNLTCKSIFIKGLDCKFAI